MITGLGRVCGTEAVWGCDWSLQFGWYATEMSVIGTDDWPVAQEGSAATEAGNVWYFLSCVKMCLTVTSLDWVPV